MNRLPLTASNLYAKNLFSFIRNLYSKDKKDFNIKGTKMNFAGLKKAEDRANLILFMREQSDNPVPLHGKKQN